MNGFLTLLRIVYVFGALLFVPCYALYLQKKCQKSAPIRSNAAKKDCEQDENDGEAACAKPDRVALARLSCGNKSEAEAAALEELFNRGIVAAQLLDGGCELTLSCDGEELAGHERVLLRLLRSAGDEKRVSLSELESYGEKRGFAFRNALLDFDGALETYMLENGWYEQVTLDAFCARKLPLYVTALQIALMAALAALLERLWGMGALTFVIMAAWFAAYRLTRSFFGRSTSCEPSERAMAALEALKAESDARRCSQAQSLAEKNDAMRVFLKGFKRLADKAYKDMGEQ